MTNKIITILILSFTLLFYYGTSSASKNRLSVTEVHVEFLSQALQNLKKDIGRYPTEEEGLELLLEPTAELEAKWKGPYLKHVIPNDAWGNKYIYHYPARYGNKDFDLYSFGANGQDDRGEKDDITNWQNINKEYYGGLSKTENVVVYLCASFLLLISAILLALSGKPVFSFLPRRYAFATLVSSLSVVAWAFFFSLPQNRTTAISGIFVLIYLFGFSLIGTIISFVSIKKGVRLSKGLLLAAINTLPILLTGGFWIYFEIIKKG